MDTPVQVLKDGLVFTINFSQWSGRVRLQPEIIKGQPIMPPKDLASLGSLKIADPEDLNAFDRLKKKMHRALGGIGVRFLGGYLVHESKGEKAAKDLDATVAEVEALKVTLRTTYAAKMEQWIAKHPGWETEIRAAMLDANDAVDRFQCSWTAFKVVAGQSEQLATNLSAATGGLTGQLYREIADVANTVIEKSILGRDKANGRILLPLKTLREKLAGLEFLDPTVKPLVDSVDHVLSKMPKGVPIEGDDMSTIYGLMLILSDTSRIRQHSEAILAGGMIGDLVDRAKPNAPKEPTPAEAAPAPEAATQAPMQQTAAVPLTVSVQAVPQMDVMPVAPVVPTVVANMPAMPSQYGTAPSALI